MTVVTNDDNELVLTRLVTGWRDFQDSPDDEEDTRDNQEYLNDLEEEFQERALLAKSKRNGHFARDCFSKTSVPSYSSPFQNYTQPRFFSSSQQKPELRPIKYFEAKYNKDKEEVSSDDNEMVEVKVLIALADDENVAVGKESTRNGEWVKISIRKYDIRKPIWYLNSGCSRHMTGVKSYLHKYVEQSGPKVVFGDDSTCTTEGYGFIKFNGIVFTKLAFVNGLKYNLISISQLCDAKYIIQYDEEQGIIFNSNKEVGMIAPRVRDVYILDMTSSLQQSCFFAKASESLNRLWHKRLAHLNFKTINQLAKQNLVIGLPSFVYSKDKPCSSCEKGKHHRANFKTKQTSSIKKCLHLLHIDLFGPVTPRSINHENYTFVIVDEYSRSTIVKRHLKTPYEIFRGRLPNIDFLHVFGCSVFIHNHKDHLGKFDEKANDGYFLGYFLFSKAFRVFNTRRQQTKETYHITFDESTKAIKFSKPSVDDINIAKLERYPPYEYLHPYEPS
ncbi:retrovirus-related pol polyprotein from transposon TNT 1-94 [Tanacetum coccineum]